MAMAVREPDEVGFVVTAEPTDCECRRPVERVQPLGSSAGLVDPGAAVGRLNGTRAGLCLSNKLVKGWLLGPAAVW